MSSDSLCFDIGAHVGNRTSTWRALGARVVAIEPQPGCIAVLNKLFGNDQAVTIVGQAVGAEQGQLTLFVDPTNPTISTLSEQWIEQVQRDPGFGGVRWHASNVVVVTTLQALIDQYGLPAFVKIDVAGFEEQVLQGLQTALPCLSFEYLPVASSSALACIDRLEALGHYVYNRSVGESHRLVYSDWCQPDEVRDFINRLTIGDRSGDIYARLQSAT